MRSKKAGRRVMQSLTRFIEGHLKLQINAAKSAVARPWDRSFLGFTVCFTEGFSLRRLQLNDSPFEELPTWERREPLSGMRVCRRRPRRRPLRGVADSARALVYLKLAFLAAALRCEDHRP